MSDTAPAAYRSPVGVLAHFIGGPLDGQSRMLEEAIPLYRVPKMPEIGFDTDPDEKIPLPEHYLYERDEKVLPGAEAIYRFKGLA